MNATTKTSIAVLCAVFSVALMAGALGNGTKWIADSTAAANGNNKFNVNLHASLFKFCWGGTSYISGSAYTAGCWQLTSNTVNDNLAVIFPFGGIFKNFDQAVQTLANASILTIAALAVSIAFGSCFILCNVFIGFRAGKLGDAVPLVCMRIGGFVLWVAVFAGMWIYLNGLLQMANDMGYNLGTSSSGQVVSGQSIDSSAFATGFWLCVGAVAFSVIACCCGCVLQEADVVRNDALPLALRGGKGSDTHTDSSTPGASGKGGDGAADDNDEEKGGATGIRSESTDLPVAQRVPTEEAEQYRLQQQEQRRLERQRQQSYQTHPRDPSAFAIQVPGTAYVIGLHPQGLQITYSYYNSNPAVAANPHASTGNASTGAASAGQGQGGKQVELIAPPAGRTGQGLVATAATTATATGTSDGQPRFTSAANAQPHVIQPASRRNSGAAAASSSSSSGPAGAGSGSSAGDPPSSSSSHSRQE